MKFGRELFADTVEEIKTLLPEYQREVSSLPDSDLFNPNFDFYICPEKSGVVRFFTARNDSGSLAGFSLYFVSPHHHYPSLIQARHDLLFIHPDHRGHSGMKFISFCDDELRNVDGVHSICVTVTESRDFSPLLVRLDYKLVERVYVRRFE